MKDYHRILELIPYIFNAAVQVWPVPMGQAMLALYTYYMLGMPLLFFTTR
jgi:hypothetical protein